MRLTPELLQRLEEAVHFSKFRAFARNTYWDEADVLEVITTVLLEHVIDEEDLLPVRVNVEDVRFTEHNHGGRGAQPESERRAGHDRRQEGRAGVGRVLGARREPAAQQAGEADERERVTACAGDHGRDQ